MTLGKLIVRFENTLLPRTNKQIVWVPCDINRPRVYCCPSQYGGGGANSSFTHNSVEKRLCVIKTKILNKSVEWTDIKVYTSA